LRRAPQRGAAFAAVKAYRQPPGSSGALVVIGSPPAFPPTFVLNGAGDDRLSAIDGGLRRLAPLAPSEKRLLGVHIDQKHLFARFHCRDAKRSGQTGFANTAFGVYERNCSHFKFNLLRETASGERRIICRERFTRN
jgi:hypothetical protein